MPEEKPAEKKKLGKTIEWSAPSRPFKVRNKKYFTTIGVTILVIGLILLLVREFLLIGVIISLAFVSYVLATVKPETVSHRVSDDGVKLGEESFSWEELISFFWSEQWDYKILNINTKKRFPGRLMMLLGEKSNQEELNTVLEHYIQKVEAPKKSVGEKALDKAGTILKLD